MLSLCNCYVFQIVLKATDGIFGLLHFCIDLFNLNSFFEYVKLRQRIGTEPTAYRTLRVMEMLKIFVFPIPLEHFGKAVYLLSGPLANLLRWMLLKRD